jgi:hypothetical protein
MGYQDNGSVASTSSSSNANVNVTQQEKTRIEIFHIRVVSKHTKIDTLFDSRSQANLISEETVKKLKLETSPHPKPYPLGWICDNAKLQVTRKCKLRFAITANFIDEVELDVIPLDICGIVLGSPYLYDRKAIFYRQENKYHLFKDGIEFIVRAHTKKMNLSIINVGKMKRLVNASKNFVLLMIKPKNDVENEAFQGCDEKLKSSLFEVVNQYDDMFKEPKGLPPKRGIQHEIQLQQDCPLPNIGMYRMSVMENAEIKKQIQELLDKGVIVPSSSPCGSPIVLVASTSSSSNANVNVTQQEKTRIEIFHIRVVSKHTKIDTLFDSRSQANLISEETVKKLKLETSPHPKPYPLGWICDNAKLQVTRKCKLRFAITANFIDEVELDVIPLDICGIVLGSPYLYDRKAIFYRQENKYHLFKDGIEFIVRAHTKKMNLSIINVGKMKRLVNASKNFVLLMIKPKNDVENEAFQGCDEKLKSSLFEVVNQYDDMFKEPKGLPPKRGIQHEIQLQQDCPLPNIGMYRMSVMENAEIKKQIQELLDKGVIVPSSSPCGSPIVLVPRIDDLLDQLKDAKYFTKLDLRSGYHQIRIAEGNTWKTAFKTKQGLFEWMVMPFGLCNAPATFMRVMNDVLRPFLDDCVIVYLDDILIFSKSHEEHIVHVKQVLDVLRKEQLFLKMSKCEFGKTSLIYLGHIVGGGELKIDPSKVKVIWEWFRPNNVTEVRSFLGAAQYWRKFIANFSSIAAPLHAVTSVKQVFQWGGKQQWAFDTLKEKISSASVLALPNLRQPFEIQTDASNYAMGAFLLQYGKPICFHSETFNGAVINYPTYDKELYALVQSVKKWKHYLLGKETIIHTDHQPLQYLQSQTKLQQARHFRWMGFLQQFHLVIRYKKGIFNKVVDMLSRPIISASAILKQSPIMHESYMEQYALDTDFKEVYETLCHSNHVEELDYHVHNNLLYHLGKLCIPQGERINIIREAHSSLIAGHFGVGKTVANLQRYCYWPKMNESVLRYVRGCSLCATSKPSNRKLGLYTPLPVPSRPWESISMDFVGGLPMSRRGHDYLYVVVDHFSKMCILMPCTKQVTAEQMEHLFFQNVWVHFGLPKSIIYDRDSRFVGSFWSSLWALMDTKLKKSIAFHPQTDGQTEVVNRTVVHLLRAYCSKHPKLWDEHLHYIQHAYNRAKHSSTQTSPFEACFGYLPKSPLDFIFGKDIVVDGQYDIDRAEKFIEQIQSIHQVVQEQLEKSQAKYKTRHDKHRVDHSFQVGDEVWLYISKERLKGEGKKLKLI